MNTHQYITFCLHLHIDTHSIRENTQQTQKIILVNLIQNLMLVYFLVIQAQAKLIEDRTLVIEESIHVTFDESNPFSTEKIIVDDDTDEELQDDTSYENQAEQQEGTNLKPNEHTS